MATSIRYLSRKLADSHAGYIIMFAIGSVLLLIMLFYNGFDIQTLYANESVTWLLSISSGLMKFLSGFGVMLTYASIVTFVFRTFANQVKGNRKRLSFLKGILILPVFAILIYATYTLVNALVYSQSLTLLENLTAVYGVWSLMLFVYIIPVASGRYNPKPGKTTLERIGERASDLRYSVWRGYQSYIWRDYGKVYSVEFERYRERMSRIRAVLSGFLLWPIALILFFLPPLGLLSILLWFRIFSLEYKPFSRLERALLISIVTVVLLVTTYLFIVSDWATLLLYFDLSYAIGMFFSIMLLGIVILWS